MKFRLLRRNRHQKLDDGASSSAPIILQPRKDDFSGYLKSEPSKHTDASANTSLVSSQVNSFIAANSIERGDNRDRILQRNENIKKLVKKAAESDETSLISLNHKPSDELSVKAKKPVFITPGMRQRDLAELDKYISSVRLQANEGSDAGSKNARTGQESLQREHTWSRRLSSLSAAFGITGNKIREKTPEAVIIKIVSFDKEGNPKTGSREMPPELSTDSENSQTAARKPKHKKKEKRAPSLFEQIAKKGDELLPNWSVGSSSEEEYSTTSVSTDDELSSPSAPSIPSVPRRRSSTRPRRRRRSSVEKDATDFGCVQPCRMVASDISLLLSEVILATNLAMSSSNTKKKTRKRRSRQ